MRKRASDLPPFQDNAFLQRTRPASTGPMIRMFVDFDGTITARDVGDALFEYFGGSEAVSAVEAYRAGEISAAECFRRECEACDEVDVQELNSFLDSQEIDETFPPFVAFCRERGIPCTIVSDGMDYYIDRILRIHGVAEVPFHSNILLLEQTKSDSQVVRFRPSFPHQDEVCERCASCKRNYMVTHAADDDILIYVGEGYSDRCPVRYADIVFAKDDLLRFCQQENISYFEYRSFSDIQSRLTDMLANDGSSKGATLRKRRQADLARRALFVGE